MTEKFLKHFYLICHQIYLKIKELKQIYNFWNSFYNIYVSIKDNCYPKSLIVQLVTEQTFEWLKLFELQYTPTRITPYEQVFGEHLVEMIERFGDVDLFNMQGLEKLNHLTTMHYFKSTNRKIDLLFQMINKRNRLELLHFVLLYEWKSYISELQMFFILKELINRVKIIK